METENGTNKAGVSWRTLTKLKTCCCCCSLKTKQRHAEISDGCVTLHRTDVASAAVCNDKYKASAMTSSRLALCKQCQPCASKRYSPKNRFDYQLSCTCNAYFTLQNHRSHGTHNVQRYDKMQRRNSDDRCLYNDLGCHGDASLSGEACEGQRSWGAFSPPTVNRLNDRPCALTSYQLCNMTYSWKKNSSLCLLNNIHR